MKTHTDDYLLGVLPSGKAVYASGNLIAQIGRERARYELVSRVWFAETGSAPGYYPVKTSLSGDTVMVRGNSHQEAINNYFRREAKKDKP